MVMDITGPSYSALAAAFAEADVVKATVPEAIREIRRLKAKDMPLRAKRRHHQSRPPPEGQRAA
jgi:hypothetical protein